MMSRISLDHAWEAVCAVRDHAARDGFPPVCLCVAAENGEEILLARMDGAPERLVSIVRAKAYTAVRMRCSTREFHERLLAENLSLADFHDPGLTSLPGGIPVMDRDVCLGAVAVSGRTLSQDVDLAEYFAHVLVKLCAMD